MEMGTDLMQLYRTEVEKFRKDRVTGLKKDEIVKIVKSWYDRGLVFERCVEYLTMYPDPGRYSFIARNFSDSLKEVVEAKSSSFLETGCFILNELRALLDNGYAGQAVGIDKMPYHMLTGFLLHGDSPQDYNLVVGDAINMKRFFSDKKFNFLYSAGMIHSLSRRESIPMYLKEARRVLKDGGLMFGNTFSKREFSLDWQVPLILSTDELNQEFDNAGFKEIKIEERPLEIPGRAKYFLYFNAR